MNESRKQTVENAEENGRLTAETIEIVKKKAVLRQLSCTREISFEADCVPIKNPSVNNMVDLGTRGRLIRVSSFFIG